MPVEMSGRFPRYTEYDPAVPVWCVTPGEGRAFHRFFDTSPISPSGRFIVFTRMPAEDRLPEPGEAAEVVVVSLTTLVLGYAYFKKCEFRFAEVV